MGLLIADGCVYPFSKNSNGITLALQEKDGYMVEQFKAAVSGNRKIVTDKRDNSKSFTIMSNKMASDLSKYGVVCNKTNSTYLPQLESKLMKHLIRGILDGDGNIGIRYIDGRKNPRIQIAFCGSEKLMYDIKDFLCKELKIKEVKVCKEKGVYSIHWNAKEDVLKLGNFLYNNASIYLKRKNEKFEIIKSL